MDIEEIAILEVVLILKKKQFQIREFSEIDSIVREVFDGLINLAIGNNPTIKRVGILNAAAWEKPRGMDPKRYLVYGCLERGLNLGEIELWLDSMSRDPKHEFYFDHSASVFLDERKLQYKPFSGGYFSAYLTQRSYS